MIEFNSSRCYLYVYSNTIIASNKRSYGYHIHAHSVSQSSITIWMSIWIMIMNQEWVMTF